jgi:alkylation response protein AidB-like acyl-CoA dehydrogenase
MTHYRSNLADIRFNLFEVFGRDKILGCGPWRDLDLETVNDMLSAGAHLAEHELAASFHDDRVSVLFDPDTGTARLPEAFKKSYESYVAAEWWRMDVDPSIGGIAVPPSLRWAMAEFPMGANPAILFYASGWPQAQILFEHGNELQRRIATWMVERHWGATMVLTEPDAGSAVGACKTRAVPQPNGTWHLEGVKRFITGAEHDMTDNIVHFVLARPTDTPGAGGSGTKGLSLFLVPKFHINPTTGELGERNGAIATNIERKMGLKASVTCELTLGRDRPAVGWLVGDVHRGIAQMFDIVEYARMLVGTKAMATLSTGYLNALEYAKTRVQGPDLARRGDGAAPQVPIIKHPDVRRSLITQKAYVEGMRALITFAACVLDDIKLARHEGRDVAQYAARSDLILPIVKGFCSEQCYAKLADVLQIFGGSGYLHDYPIEQYIRDAKIDTIYEGTTAIQGIDLFFRKIVRDDGRALDGLLAEVGAHALELRTHSNLHDMAANLEAGLSEIRRAVSSMRMWNDRAPQEPFAVYRIGLQTTRLLMMLAELLVGWLLLRQAVIAEGKLADPTIDSDHRSFYVGKIAVARFFGAERLPVLTMERQLLESDSTIGVMTISDDAL